MKTTTEKNRILQIAEELTNVNISDNEYDGVKLMSRFTILRKSINYVWPKSNKLSECRGNVLDKLDSFESVKNYMID